MSALVKLRNAFITGLALPPDTDVDNATYGQTDGWDSVAHMALIAEIEAAFDIMLETDQVIGMSTFSKAIEIVGNHGVDVHA